MQVIETPRKQWLKQDLCLFCLQLHEVQMSRLVWEFYSTEASEGGVLPLPAPYSALLQCGLHPHHLSWQSKEKGIKRPRTHASYLLGKVLRISNTLPPHPIGKNIVMWPPLPARKPGKCLSSGWLYAQLKLCYYRGINFEAIRGL